MFSVTTQSQSIPADGETDWTRVAMDGSLNKAPVVFHSASREVDGQTVASAFACLLAVASRVASLLAVVSCVARLLAVASRYRDMSRQKRRLAYFAVRAVGHQRCMRPTSDLSRVFCEAAQSVCERTLHRSVLSVPSCERTVRRSELQRRSVLRHLAKVHASSQSMADIPKMLAVGRFGHQLVQRTRPTSDLSRVFYESKQYHLYASVLSLATSECTRILAAHS